MYDAVEDWFEGACYILEFEWVDKRVHPFELIKDGYGVTIKWNVKALDHMVDLAYKQKADMNDEKAEWLQDDDRERVLDINQTLR